MLTRFRSLITSQIDTAPKLRDARGERRDGLITSQIDTAPKHGRYRPMGRYSLITSQIDTAPKQEEGCAEGHIV